MVDPRRVCIGCAGSLRSVGVQLMNAGSKPEWDGWIGAPVQVAGSVGG